MLRELRKPDWDFQIEDTAQGRISIRCDRPFNEYFARGQWIARARTFFQK